MSRPEHNKEKTSLCKAMTCRSVTKVSGVSGDAKKRSNLHRSSSYSRYTLDPVWKSNSSQNKSLGKGKQVGSETLTRVLWYTHSFPAAATTHLDLIKQSWEVLNKSINFFTKYILFGDVCIYLLGSGNLFATKKEGSVFMARKCKNICILISANGLFKYFKMLKNQALISHWRPCNFKSIQWDFKKPKVIRRVIWVWTAQSL